MHVAKPIARRRNRAFVEVITAIMRTAGPLLVAGLCVLAMTSAAASSSMASDALLERRVHALLQEHTRDLGRETTITLHRSAARLPPCDDPQPFLTHPEQRLYGRVAVGVRCGEQGNQVRYLQAEVSVLVDHVVTASDIDRGATITAAALRLEEARLERLPRHALLNIDEAVGLMAARPLSAGTTLQTHHLRREALVKRGNQVTVMARGTGFSVTRKAKALDNGSLGESVRLRTEDGDRLKATVIGRNQLEVAF